jgi:DNA invertase Pin-like site-specific DNA recombinase
MPEIAGIYARLSFDKSGESESTERQVATCEAHAKALEWSLAPEPFVDNDISAFTAKALRRPGYDRLVAAVKTGAITIVLVWKLDRIHRNLGQYSELMKLLEAHNCRLVSVADAFDSGNVSNRMMGQMLAMFAENESHNTSTRTKAAMRAQAAQGKPHSGRRPFGYQFTEDRSSLTVDPIEGPLLQEAAQRVADGDVLAQIVKDLNDAGMTTTMGNKWTVSTLSRTLQSPTSSGVREIDGVSYEGNWPALITPDVRLQMDARWEKNKNGRESAATSLLTGIIRCAACKQRMSRMVNAKDYKDNYACRKGQGLENCGRISASRKQVDELVTEALFLHLEAPSEAQEDTAKRLEEIEAEITAEAQKKARLLDLYASGADIDKAQFFALNDECATRLDALERERASLFGSALDGGPIFEGNYRDWWKTASLSEQRSLVRQQILSVMVHPSKNRGRVFDISRVEVVWKASVQPQPEQA